MPYPTQVFQNDIARQLRGIYPNIDIKVEWSTFGSTGILYSPRIDVAVGPFSIVDGGNFTEEYNDLMQSSRPFIERLIHYHHANLRAHPTGDSRIDGFSHFADYDEILAHNHNARCLLAVEIENEVSRKHLLGGAVNAAALGRLGVVVGWTPKNVKALTKLKAYWEFLKNVKGIDHNTKNLLILSPDQLREAVNAASYRG